MEDALKPVRLPEPETDLLNREQFSQILTDFIKNHTQGVMALNSPWGGGKTFFIEKMLIDKLKAADITYIKIDVFESDYYKDPFTVIAENLLYNLWKFEVIDKPRMEKLYNNFKTFSLTFGAGIKNNLPTILGAVIPKLDSLGGADIGKIIKIIAEEALNAEKKANSGLSNAQYDLMQWYDRHSDEIKVMKNLIETLKEAVASIKQTPLVVIIDELDRCRPDFSVELLEKIKHIFSVDGIIFLLATNPDQLEGAIKNIYGSEIDAREYLQKFFDIQFSLPAPSAKNGCWGFIEFYLKHLDIDYESYEIKYKESFMEICSRLSLHLRDIQKAFQVISIIGIGKFQFDISVVFYLVIAKIKNLAIYNIFINNDADEMCRILTTVPSSEMQEIINRSLFRTHCYFRCYLKMWTMKGQELKRHLNNDDDLTIYLKGMALHLTRGDAKKSTMIHLLKNLSERIDYVFEFTNIEQ